MIWNTSAPPASKNEGCASVFCPACLVDCRRVDCFSSLFFSLSLSSLSSLFFFFSLSSLFEGQWKCSCFGKKKLEWDFQRGKVQEREKSLREKIFLFLRSCVWDLICLMLVIATKDQYPSVWGPQWSRLRDRRISRAMLLMKCLDASLRMWRVARNKRCCDTMLASAKHEQTTTSDSLSVFESLSKALFVTWTRCTWHKIISFLSLSLSVSVSVSLSLSDEVYLYPFLFTLCAFYRRAERSHSIINFSWQFHNKKRKAPFCIFKQSRQCVLSCFKYVNCT